VSHDLNTLLRELFAAKERHHRLKQQADEATREYRALEHEALEALEELGVKTYTVALAGYGEVRFTARKPTIYGRINDPDAAYAALEQAGRAEEIFAPKAAAGRLNEYVRECLEQGIPLPEGVDFYANAGVTVARVK